MVGDHLKILTCFISKAASVYNLCLCTTFLVLPKLLHAIPVGQSRFTTWLGFSYHGTNLSVIQGRGRDPQLKKMIMTSLASEETAPSWLHFLPQLFTCIRAPESAMAILEILAVLSIVISILYIWIG